jgi:hypothetical protein
MNGEWSGNNFLLGSSTSIATHDGHLGYFFFFLPTY